MLYYYFYDCVEHNHIKPHTESDVVLQLPCLLAAEYFQFLNEINTVEISSELAR